MNLARLLEALPEKAIYGYSEVSVEQITFDSRTAVRGALFVAIRGWEQDGHRFINDAISRGASVVVAEEAPTKRQSELVIWVVVPNSRLALALLAAASNDYPSRKLRVIGVTGTDGKTTTTNIIAAVLRRAGYQVGVLSTIQAEIAGDSVDTGFHTTTPNPLDVQRYMAQMVISGARYAVLETTSHAIDQERTGAVDYDVAAITNVTAEHLDYHHSYGQYLATKGRLFASVRSSYRKPGMPKVCVLNVDDVSYGYLRQFRADVALTYGINGDADVHGRNVELVPTGANFVADTPVGQLGVHSPLPGRHNVYNTLAAIATTVALDIPPAIVIEGIATMGQLTGRWERAATGEDFAVVIDFAHTPHALEEALELARSQSTGRVIVVFGCAGLRDREKRPAMGKIAGRLADVAVLTAEDPRTEDVGDIINQIAVGCESAGGRSGETYFAIPDRAEAVAFAVAMAQRGDLILLAGKGHERSLCIGDVETPWSEHEAVTRAVARRQISNRSGGGGSA